MKSKKNSESEYLKQRKELLEEFDAADFKVGGAGGQKPNGSHCLRHTECASGWCAEAHYPYFHCTCSPHIGVACNAAN